MGARDSFLQAFIGDMDVTMSFSSSYEIFETQYKCTVGSEEYNYTNNPTVVSGSQGQPYDYVTGSYFSPYVTCVGLYNENTQLVAVGKLSFPAPISQFTDTTIIVNFDQ